MINAKEANLMIVTMVLRVTAVLTPKAIIKNITQLKIEPKITVGQLIKNIGKKAHTELLSMIANRTLPPITQHQ